MRISIDDLEKYYRHTERESNGTYITKPQHERKASIYNGLRYAGNTDSRLTDAMFTHEMDKYRGSEMSYVFAREKLKGSIPVERFDNYTFSTYGNYDVNGRRSFVSPLEHFNKLEEYIKSDNDIMTAHMMEQTENKLGIKSMGRQNYNAEQKAKLQTMTANTSRLI